ncbi:hypothetical protein FQN52_002066 [Onygenales sp. PD_12]|nr:hypothetical protein FQN52_002066 [Onygenales sp. PD_12]
MSSFFSPKSKSQRTSLPSNDPEQAVQSTGYRGFGGRSTFSKMRKKRPPPINISVENGNVFINGPNPDAKAFCRDPTWLPSPQTPHGPGYMHPTCREGEMFLVMSPPFSSFCGGRHSCATPTVTSNCQSPTSQYFPAELPGSMRGTVESSELDALSTPIRQSYEASDDHGYGTPPDLTYSPYQNACRRQRELEPAPLQPQKHNSRPPPPPDIDFWELLEILPNLSPDEIKMHWRPAMLELAPQIKSLEEMRGDVEREGRDEAVAMEEPSRNHEDIERLKTDFAARLDSKEQQLSELHHLHNSHLDLLCTFISNHLPPELAQPTDPDINEINALLANHHRHHHPHHNSEQEQHQPNRDPSTPITARSRSESTTSTNPLQSPLPHPPQAHPPPPHRTTHPIRNPNQQHHHHHLIQSLREKDAQISILNTKVAQLLMMSSPNANPNPSGTALYRASTAAESSRIEKDLPSPGPGAGFRVGVGVGTGFELGYDLGQTETDWYADGWGCGWDG